VDADGGWIKLKTESDSLHHSEDGCGAQARKAASKWTTLLVCSSFAETLMALLNSKTCFDSSFSRAQQLHSL